MNKKETSSSYSHILKYTSIFGGVQGLVILIGMVRNKLIALLLGPQGMGLMALFNSTVRLISDTTGLGLGVSAVRELSRLYDEEHHEELKNRVNTFVERDNSVLRICFVRCFESIDQPLQLFVGQSHPTLHAFGTYYRPNCFICR